MDEQTRNAVDRWLTKSDHDLQTARILLEHQPELTAVVCYHSQQCAEKALKAYLVSASVHVERTHYLPRLLELCRERDPSFSEHSKIAEQLTDYAVSTRYPDVEEADPTLQEATAAVEAATGLLEFVKSRIPPE